MGLNDVNTIGKHVFPAPARIFKIKHASFGKHDEKSRNSCTFVSELDQSSAVTRSVFQPSFNKAHIVRRTCPLGKCTFLRCYIGHVIFLGRVRVYQPLKMNLGQVAVGRDLKIRRICEVLVNRIPPVQLTAAHLKLIPLILSLPRLGPFILSTLHFHPCQQDQAKSVAELVHSRYSKQHKDSES